jgi:antitoxin SocA-like protein
MVSKMPDLKKWPENETKYQELVLYICQKCATDPKFGATKLNKLLYFSDFLAYAMLGEPITGFEYQRLPNGPAPRRMLPMRERMEKHRALGFQVVPLKGGRTQRRAVNLRAPDLSVFTAAQISLVDRIIEELWDLDADAVSDLSHRMIGWKLADPGETIPYETVFISSEPLTETDVQRARELRRLVHESTTNDH